MTPTGSGAVLTRWEVTVGNPVGVMRGARVAWGYLQVLSSTSQMEFSTVNKGVASVQPRAFQGERQTLWDYLAGACKSSVVMNKQQKDLS